MVLTTEDISAIQAARATIEALQAKQTKVVSIAEAAIGVKRADIAAIESQRDTALAGIDSKIATQQAIIDSYADKAAT